MYCSLFRDETTGGDVNVIFWRSFVDPSPVALFVVSAVRAWHGGPHRASEWPPGVPAHGTHTHG